MILDPIVAMQMGVQGQVDYFSLCILYFCATNATELDCHGVSLGWNPILGSKDGE